MEAKAEIVAAAATGSTGGLGKIGTVLNAAAVYIRVPTNGHNIGWRVRSDTVHTVQKYRARDVYNTATITLGTAPLDDTDTFILNGLTYTAEATASTADFASRKFSIAGNTAAQCTELTKLINADYSVISAGTSVAATDKLTITTDEGVRTIVCAAAADYPAGKYITGTAAAELASIVLAINHRDTITVGTDATSITAANATDTAKGYALAIELIADHNTHTASTAFHSAATTAVSSTASTTEATLIAQANVCRYALAEHYNDSTVHGGVTDQANQALVLATTLATSEATAWTLLNALKVAHAAHIATARAATGDKVVINDITFTAGASTVAATRTFDVSGATASADADELCVCINDGTYGVPGVTAVNTSGAVALTRTTSAPLTVHVHYTHPHTPLRVTAAGGVPGVLASTTGATGELCITPVWTKVLTVTEAGDQLTVVDIDIPGVYAVAGATTVTLSCTTPGNPAGGEKATVLHFAQGTSDANEATFADTTLAGTTLVLDGAASVDVAANSAVAGSYYSQSMDGWEYAYLGVTNKSGAGAMTLSVGANQY